jgi:hypothetical protein
VAAALDYHAVHPDDVEERIVGNNDTARRAGATATDCRWAAERPATRQ